MTGHDHIVRAIEVFEASLDPASLDTPIRSVAELARLAGYSVHHFTRLFTVVVGMSPKDYMDGRTLTVATRDVIDTGAPLKAIAERLGFRDYETFSRAFRRRFGVPPSRVRETGASPDGGTSRAIPAHPRSSTGASAVPEPALVQVEAFTVTGVSFYLGEKASSFHTIWETFMRVHERVRGRVVPETYYQVTSWSETDDLPGFAVLCGLGTEEGVEQEPFFVTRVFPATECLRFVHPGRVETIRDTYEYIYREYLPANDVQLEFSWEYQRYPGGDTIEVYLPVGLRT